MSEYGHCELCGLPLVEVDAYGQRLRGCMGCNNCQEVSSGEWLRLSEEDIAIRGWNVEPRESGFEAAIGWLI